MNVVEIVTGLLVLCGVLFMFVAILRGEKTKEYIPREVLRRWRVMILLMVFFLTGYLAFLTVLVGRIRFPLELVTGLVFLGGAVFVYIVISLTRDTIARIKNAEENLKELNETLENRIQARTAELQQSQSFLKTVLDSLNDAVMTIDTKDFKILLANKPFLRGLGVQEEEVIGRTCYEVTHHRRDVCTPPDDACPLVETVKTGTHCTEEHIHYTKEGKKIYVEVSASPIKDNDGAIVQVVHVARDVSEKRRAEEILQESEKRFRMLFESAGDAIFILEAEGTQAGNIIAANTAAAEAHGYTVDELIGKNIKDLDIPDEGQDSPHLIQRVVSGEWIKTEMRHFRKNGTTFPVEVSAGLLELGDHRYILSFDRDISERKKAEEQLHQYATELKQSNEDVLSFANIVSHDLRAPLVSIKGFTGELQYALQDIESVLTQCIPHLGEKERARLNTAIQKDAPVAMKFIESSVSRMDGLINAILALSREGHRELKPEVVDMKDLTGSILSSLAHQIERSKTSVIVEGLPLITADKIAMGQIMGNLLDNALKYLEQGREGKVVITAEQGAHETTFHVSDNGRGIAQEDMHKVFEIFRRAGKQDVPGEGMGLAYVKALVRRQGGRIWCESERGKGTTFSFTVPGSVP
ncbi:MAG: PAS domain S-box protein [Nitrospirae bacterium]|nr:PAS domain S-box protein [Nitrospirota bacterium]